jgi:glucose-6-phosphate dehydrogenase assembly protein OpcA
MTADAPAPTINLEPARPGEPTLRWSSRVHSIEGIERELARIWSIPRLTVDVEGKEQRRIAARTSVMNLVVIARRPELGEQAGAEISALTGRHPSRTLIVAPMDADGPSWLDARIRAYCMLPRADAPETCAESIFVVAGGEAGRHLPAIVAPLLVHDLPVTIWWLGDPPFGTRQAEDVLELADRLVVDGSSWSGDGLDRLRDLAALTRDEGPEPFDFSLVRQARWREAIASTFDRPDLTPYLGSIRRMSVSYASRLDAPAGTTNIVRPVYHVAWLASRLGMSVARPLAEATERGRGAGPARRGRFATLRSGNHDVAVVVRPLESTKRAGTTLRVELLAERRGSELRVDVTAETEVVRVHAWEDGIEILDRRFHAPRRTDVELLGEAIESTRHDPITRDAILAAGDLLGEATP